MHDAQIWRLKAMSTVSSRAAARVFSAFPSENATGNFVR